MREYGRHALLGMVMVAASLVATKMVGVLAQFAVGWLLTADDYKQWGFVLSLRMFVDGFRHGGALPIIQQWGERATSRARAFAQYCMIFNVLSAIALVMLIPVAHRYFRTDSLTGLVVTVALSLFPVAIAGVYRSLLEVDLRFASAAKLASLSMVVYYVSMVVCAALGLGAYALAIPLVIHPTMEWICYRKATGPIQDDSRLTKSLFLEILQSSKWIMMSAVATAVAMTGDYLVIGRVAPDLLGPYLFGFQQTVAFSTLIVAGFQRVLLPTFAKLQDEPARMGTAFRKSVSATALVCGPVLAAAAVVAPLIVHTLWQGKWDAAIPVVQVMSLCLVFRLFNPLAASVMQAMGRWNVFAQSLSLDAIAVLFGAWLGSQRGDMSTVAIAVGGFRCLVVPVMIAISARVVGLSAFEMLRFVGARTCLPVASVIIIWAYQGLPGPFELRTVALNLLIVGLASLVNALLFRRELREIRSVMLPKR